MVPKYNSLYLASQIAVRNMSLFGSGYEATKPVMAMANQANDSKLVSLVGKEETNRKIAGVTE